MLNKSLDKKLFVLKLCLYSIIFIICSIGGYKAVSTYKYISNLTADDISKWLNKTSDLNCSINAKKIKLNFQGFNIYFILDEMSARFSTHTIVTSQQITARINILSTVLSGKININNFVAKNVKLTANSLYPSENIALITGNIYININFSKPVDKILDITSEFVADNIDFKIDTSLNLQSNNIKIIKFKLENTANNVRDIIKYLPEHLINKKLLYWLNTSLLSGSVKHSELLLDEDDIFVWKVKFKEIKLKYATNWPAIENLSATMEIVDDNLNIDIEPGLNKGFIFGQPIKQLNAKLTGMNLDKIPPLLIKADIITSVKMGVEFLKKTDLRHLGDNLSKLSPNGKMNLSIQLLLPIDNLVRIQELIKFSGNCELIQANIKPLNFDLNITDLNGNIKFANNYLAADDLQGKIFGTTMHTKFVLDHDYLFIENPLFNTKILLDQNKKNKIFEENLDIILEELFLFDNVFHKIRFVNNSDSKTIFFESQDAKGTFVYSDLNSGQYYINFDKLKLNTKNLQSNSNNFDLLMSIINQVKFNCENFYLNEIYLGQIGSNFIKDIKSSDKKLIYIDKLYLITKEINVDAVGNWQIKDSKTNINGKLSSTNFSEAFKQFSSNNKFIKNGHGFINFNLEWLNNPFGFNLTNIVGTLNLDIHSGVIVGVNPGIGRIIGLLNIENIQRRLQLDFSDVTGGGFSFDTLNGDLHINKGNVVLNNVIIYGPSANLTINGNTALISQQLDLSIEVTSKVGATLPLAAAIAAGNPVVGAALWLFNHASGAKVSEFKVQKYKVTGTWSKPEINVI